MDIATLITVMGIALGALVGVVFGVLQRRVLDMDARLSSVEHRLIEFRATYDALKEAHRGD